MKFPDIAKILKDIPHMLPPQGEIIYDFILNNRIKNVLELGFAHGTSSCYIAAALDENKKGSLTTVDLKAAFNRAPNIYSLLEKTGLGPYVNTIFTETSYNWELHKMIKERSKHDRCIPTFDFCFIDGAHTWGDDGFAFFLVDKLLLPNSWILFDDIEWNIENSPSLSTQEWTKRLPEYQRSMKQIKEVFNILVRQHPNYECHRIDGNWGWAKKVAAPRV